MFTSRANLNLNQTHRHHTVCARHSNRLITLQLTNSTTTLTSQSSIVLTIGNSSVLQLIQSKTMSTTIDTESHNSLKTCNRQVIHINRHIIVLLLFCNKKAPDINLVTANLIFRDQFYSNPLYQSKHRSLFVPNVSLSISALCFTIVPIKTIIQRVNDRNVTPNRSIL